jgi:hypothetical protein
LKLKQNPIFQRHKVQIAEAIESVSPSARKTGQQLFDQMILSAEELDNVFDINPDKQTSPQILNIKREEFQKKCRDLGEWLSEYAPDLKLTWD